MGTIDSLRSLIAAKFPAAPPPPPSAALPTGLPCIDALTGGLPGNSLTECSGPLSCGSLLLHALLETTASRQSFAALIDPACAFDPGSYPPDLLPRLLWAQPPSPAKALAAADLLLRDANLPLVILDLQLCLPQDLQKLPTSSWHRLQRLLESSSAALLVLSRFPSVPSARLRLHLHADHRLAALATPRHELAPALSASQERIRPLHHAHPA
ncbi:MAG: hypothetical protein RLZZ179_2611 [Verrucomicrobiota bacterium]